MRLERSVRGKIKVGAREQDSKETQILRKLEELGRIRGTPRKGR